MASILFWKEVRLNLMTFRFGAALVTIFALTLVSLWVLGNDYTRRLNAYNLAVEDSNEQNKQIVVPSQYSPLIHRPPAPLSIFAQGEDRRLGNSLRVNRWEVPRRATGSFNDNMLMLSEPSLDFLSIVVIVVSLFGILFGYDQISGERERGTLKSLLAAGASRAGIYLSKYIASVLCLAIPLLLSLVSGLLMLNFILGITFTGSEWLALVMIFVTSVFYASLFVAIGFASSSIFKKSSIALIFSLLVWSFTVLIVPGAAKGIADLVAPLPSDADVVSLERSSLQNAASTLKDFSQEHPRYWGGYWTSGWSIPGSGGCLKFDGSESSYSDSIAWVHTIEPMMQKRAEDIWNSFRQMNRKVVLNGRIFDSVSVLSPAFQLQKSFMMFAGTDYITYRDFIDYAQRLRRQIINNFSGKGYFDDNASMFFSRRPAEEIKDAAFTGRSNEYRRRIAAGQRTDEFMNPRNVWGYLPDSELPAITFSESTQDMAKPLIHVLIIFISSACFMLVGIFSFMRYDVR